MKEQLFEKRPTRAGRLARLGVAGALLGLPLAAASSVRGAETAESNLQYVNLPGWDCPQDNLLGKTDRGVIDYTRPDTSINDGLIVITYPAIDQEENRFHQTVIYEDPGLKAGDTLRYFASDSRDCPLPEGASVIPTS